MIYIKTAEEIVKMRAACDLVSRTLGEVAKWAVPESRPESLIT